MENGASVAGARDDYDDEIDLRELFAVLWDGKKTCLLYTSPSPRDGLLSRMPSSA